MLDGKRNETITPEELVQIGMALYGRWGWQLKLSAALGVNENTIRRWKTGHSPIFPKTVLKLRQLSSEQTDKAEISESAHARMLKMLSRFPFLRVSEENGVFTLHGDTEKCPAGVCETDIQGLEHMENTLNSSFKE